MHKNKNNVLVLLENWKDNYLKKNVGINISLQDKNVFIYCNKKISGGENLNIIENRISKFQSGIIYTLIRFIRITFVLLKYRITEVNWCYITDDELMIFCIFKKIFKRKLIIYVKADSEDITLNRSFKFRKYFLDSIDKLFVENEQIQSTYRKIFKKTSIIFLLNPSYFEFKGYLPKKTGNSSGRLLYVGRVSPEKNILGLLNIFKKFAQKNKERCLNLVLLQDDLNYWNLVENEIDIMLGCGFKINIYLNPEDDILYDFYVNSDILCLTSINEGLPNVLSDAFYMGLPVVSFRVGSIPTILTDHDLLCTREFEFVKNLENLIINTNYENKREKYMMLYDEKMSVNTFKQHLVN